MAEGNIGEEIDEIFGRVAFSQTVLAAGKQIERQFFA
jgi:hypothetical protein